MGDDMNVRARVLGVVVLVLAIGLVGCGGDGEADGSTSVTTGADVDTTVPEEDSEDTTTTTEAATTTEAVASGAGPGEATLTVGDETWTFDNYLCAFGYDATQSQTFSFSSTSFGEHSTGARVQMLVDIADESGGGRYQGDGVEAIITINDISDFENQAVSWEANSSDGVFGTGPFDVVVEGDSVAVASANFDSGLTDEREAVPGTFQGTCGQGSRR